MPGPGAQGDAPWPLWQRIIRGLVPGVIRVGLWGFALVLTASGVVTWRNWSALAARGKDATARVQQCTLKTMFRKGGGGFHACTYSYRVSPEEALNEGRFQSGPPLEAGQPIAIRYLPDEPATSAAAADLEHANLIAAAMTAVGVAFLARPARTMQEHSGCTPRRSERLRNWQASARASPARRNR